MRGVILAGGHATRMRPATRVTNKHLLPVWDKPMIFYPIETLVRGGVTEILIVLGGNSVGDVVNLLGDGSEFGARFTYVYQAEPLGIAHAISLAEDFAHGETIAVILGDNIFLDSFDLTKLYKPTVFLVESKEPQRFGVGRFEEDSLVEIIEKPKDPSSNWIVSGLYFYSSDVFEMIATLKPSARGELEVTDLNNAYIEQGRRLDYVKLDGGWYDAGTFDSWLKATQACMSQGK